MTLLKTQCVCPDCDCMADDSFEKDGKSYCSESCANGHVDGAGCGHNCGCHG